MACLVELADVGADTNALPPAPRNSPATPVAVAAPAPRTRTVEASRTAVKAVGPIIVRTPEAATPRVTHPAHLIDGGCRAARDTVGLRNAVRHRCERLSRYERCAAQGSQTNNS